MATLIGALETNGGASAIWNEFEITVTSGEWENEATGAVLAGWTVHVNDFLTASDREARQRGMRAEIVRQHHAMAWDDLVGLMAELGVPDEYEGWPLAHGRHGTLRGARCLLATGCKSHVRG